MFFAFGIKDFIDILLVALLLYYTYKLMKASGSLNVFIGILVFILIWLVVSQVLEMKLLGSIFDKLVSVGVLALIILFQEEIRRFLLTLGSHRHIKKFVNFFTGNKQADVTHEDIMPIVMACVSMSRQKVGALIVIEHDMPLDDVVRTGDVIDANINQRLIENIFFKNSPLHDGAMGSSARSASRPRAASCPCPTTWTSPRNWACATVPHWASRRCATPMPSLFPRRQAVSPWPIRGSSTCASRPRDWRAC